MTALDVALLHPVRRLPDVESGGKLVVSRDFATRRHVRIALSATYARTYICIGFPADRRAHDRQRKHLHTHAGEGGS